VSLKTEVGNHKKNYRGGNTSHPCYKQKVQQVTETAESSDSDFAFAITRSRQSSENGATVSVRINGVKGRMEADSCSTVNTIDKERFEILKKLSPDIKLQQTDTQLFAYAQQEPIKLAGVFESTIESVSTGRKVSADILVVKGATSTRPLLSLNTSVDLGLIHLTHVVNKSDQTLPKEVQCNTVQESDSCADILDRYKSSVFTGLGKHKYFKASLIVDESVTPIVHKQRRIPFNLVKQAHQEEPSNWVC
jgi:hypothetical protein